MSPEQIAFCRDALAVDLWLMWIEGDGRFRRIHLISDGERNDEWPAYFDQGTRENIDLYNTPASDVLIFTPPACVDGVE